MDSPILPFEKRKKKSHDLAYLIILLAILLGSFLFVMLTVPFLLRGIPIPH